MPVPGSLKRRPVDEKELADLLERQFKIKTIETRAYLNLLEKNDMTLQELAHVLDLPLDEGQALPLHPRMTMTNIFKVYEKEVVDALRDHRATVDRVVNLLTPIYEERKIRTG